MQPRIRTETAARNEHGVVLGTCLETSGDEHASAADHDTPATSEVVSDPGCERDGSEGSDVLDSTEENVRIPKFNQNKKLNILVQAKSGALGGSKVRDPVGDSLETV